MTEVLIPLLHDAVLGVEGTLIQASNATVRVTLHPAGTTMPEDPADHTRVRDDETAGILGRAVYKPVRGERPLADFPAGSLAAREVAAYLVSELGGWHLVPPTVLRDGPFGPGSVQWWVEQTPERYADPTHGLVDVVTPQELPVGWRTVVEGSDAAGSPVVVAHADHAELRSVAVLDLALNNADRKAVHLTRDLDGRLRCFDHGLSFHVCDKIRTVLWGFAREPLPPADVGRLERLLETLEDDQGEAVRSLRQLLAALEVDALRRRVEGLLVAGRFPPPPADRYPLPWPLW